MQQLTYMYSTTTVTVNIWCASSLQEKIMKLLEKKHRENLDLNINIQKRKDFRNPRWGHERDVTKYCETSILQLLSGS